MGILPDVIANLARHYACEEAQTARMDSPVTAPLCEWFINEVGLGVGELTPTEGEEVDEIVRCLSASALRLLVRLHIWKASGLVYFRVEGRACR